MLAHIIFGAVIDENMQEEVKVTVIATGFDKEEAAVNAPNVHAYNQQPLTAAAPRYAERQPIVPAMSTNGFDTPAFIRKKAD